MSFYLRHKLEAENQELKAKASKPHIRVAVSALVIRNAEALLVEFNDTSGLHYNFPGGGVEVGETLEEALRREIKEETSLHVSIERFLLVVESVGSRNSNLVDGRRRPWNEVRFFFLCSPAGDSVARLPERADLNETAIRWISLDALQQVNVLPQVSERLIEALSSLTTVPLIVPNPHP